VFVLVKRKYTIICNQQSLEVVATVEITALFDKISDSSWFENNDLPEDWNLINKTSRKNRGVYSC
jgi:hypothetical protein